MNATEEILNNIAYLFILSGFVSMGIIAIDILYGHRQKMAIMNIVWPLTGLYFCAAGLLAYFWFGRAAKNKKEAQPFWQAVFVATTHCGAGCTLGDVLGEFGIYLFGIVLFSSILVTMFTIDFLMAYLFGIVFQYLSIAPMRGLNFSNGVKAAVKADTLSLVCFETGMFACMAYTHYKFPHIKADSLLYWFFMQLAMIAGFITSYPANWFLVIKGIKERM